MNKKPLKLAVVFNEAHPDFYYTPEDNENKNVDFIPFFEVEKLTPLDEFEIIAIKPQKADFNAYTLKITDDILFLLKEIKKIHPDVIFNFVEHYKEDSRLEMNCVSFLELSGVPYTGAPPNALS